MSLSLYVSFFFSPGLPVSLFLSLFLSLSLFPSLHPCSSPPHFSPSSLSPHHSKEAIFYEFPPPPPPLSALALERSYHLHFVEDRSRQFIGRRDLMETLQRHAQASFTSDSLPLVVVGSPGSGKTSLVSAFARWFAELNTDVVCIVHVVSASPTSTDIREVLLRICRECKERFPAIDFTPAEDRDYQVVKDGFFRVLEAAGEAALAEKTHILLIIDAINQLNPFYGAHAMDWFPTYTPPGVKSIVSTVPDSATLSALTKRDPRPPQLDVPGLR